ncbi:MAG: carboxypeptidase-like regulatory domain-containing protein [Flavisolibacter sp.]|nr:carboxypeptidase-like regulatory domain-containing protein [Flavisolibacter sp.]
MRKEILLLLAFSFCWLASCIGQTTTISGKVKDQQGYPLVGAIVTVKGTSISTVTDTAGFFSISFQTKNAANKLVVTYVGFRRPGTSAW